MNAYHKDLLEEVKKYSRMGTSHSSSDSYLGSGHFYYSVAVPKKREVVKKWVKEHTNISFAEYLALLNSLYTSQSYEEKTMASLLLEYLPQQRKQLNPHLLDSWLNELHGWAEIDCLCQSNFSAKEILVDWTTWKDLIKKFSHNNNISKRRASLVLLTGPVSHSENKELAILAFSVIDTLKSEKDILITKAISWLLRSLVKFHKEDVKKYVVTNKDFLPKIAVRETMRKIETGRK